jgi:hypothetical protein
MLANKQAARCWSNGPPVIRIPHPVKGIGVPIVSTVTSGRNGEPKRRWELVIYALLVWPRGLRRWDVVMYALDDWPRALRLCAILIARAIAAAAPTAAVVAWLLLRR